MALHNCYVTFRKMKLLEFNEKIHMVKATTATTTLVLDSESDENG